jgi:hypothetical protein
VQPEGFLREKNLLDGIKRIKEEELNKSIRMGSLNQQGDFNYVQ